MKCHFNTSVENTGPWGENPYEESGSFALCNSEGTHCAPCWDEGWGGCYHLSRLVCEKHYLYISGVLAGLYYVVGEASETGHDLSYLGPEDWNEEENGPFDLTDEPAQYWLNTLLIEKLLLTEVRS